MVRLFDAIWRDELMPLLRSHGVEIVALDALDRAQKDAAREHFRSTVFPALTPRPSIRAIPSPTCNKSLNLAAVLHREGRSAAPGAVRRTWRWCRCPRC